MKYKKPNLSTVERTLDRGKPYILPNGGKITLSLSGFFTVTKAGESRLYSRLVDAWRAL